MRRLLLCDLRRSGSLQLICVAHQCTGMCIGVQQILGVRLSFRGTRHARRRGLFVVFLQSTPVLGSSEVFYQPVL